MTNCGRFLNIGLSILNIKKIKRSMLLEKTYYHTSFLFSKKSTKTQTNNRLYEKSSI